MAKKLVSLRLFVLFLCYWSLVGPWLLVAQTRGVQELNNGSSILSFSDSGKLLSLRSIFDGTSVLGSPGPMGILTYADNTAPGGRRSVESNSCVALGDNRFRLGFEGTTATVDLRIQAKNSYFVFQILAVQSLPRGTESIVFIRAYVARVAQEASSSNVSWVLNAAPNTIFVHALAANPETVCSVGRPYQCSAHTALPFAGSLNFVGAKAFLVTTAKQSYFQTLENMIKSEGLPYLQFGGQWFRATRAFDRQSYLLTYLSDKKEGSVSQFYYPTIKELMLAGGFKQIIILDSLYHGTYDVPRTAYWTDKVSFVNALKEFKNSGIGVGLHTFLNTIDPAAESRLFNPANPGVNLFKVRLGSLSGGMTVSSDSLDLGSPLAENPAWSHFAAMGGLPATLLIGNEILTASAQSGSTFTRLTRGIYKTSVSEHQAGDALYLLPVGNGGFYIAAGESAAKRESVSGFAATAGSIGLNLIFDDGLPQVPQIGMDSVSEPALSYYFAEGEYPYLKALSEPVAIQFGNQRKGSYSFYYHRKTAAFDAGVLKSKAYTRNSKVAIMRNANRNPYANFIFEMGWWTPNGAQFALGKHDFDAVTIDDFQYAMAKTFAYGTSMGMEIGAFWDTNKLRQEIFALAGKYHRLFDEESGGRRLPEEVYEYLRDPEHEADLVEEAGTFRFVKKKVVTKYLDLANVSGAAEVALSNPFARQKLKLQIRPRFDYLPYSSGAHEVLFDSSDSSALQAKALLSDDIQCVLSPNGTLRVQNSGATVGGCSIAVTAETFFDLSFKRGIGIDISGDGRNELVVVRLTSASFPIFRDFKFTAAGAGRQTHLLGDPTVDAYDYVATGGPADAGVAQNAGRRCANFDYSKVKSVAVMVYVGPGDFTLQLHSLKALVEKERSPLVRPELSLGGNKIVFPVTLYMDDTNAHILEYDGRTRTYGLLTSNNGLLRSGSIEQDAVVVAGGENQLTVKADTTAASSSRRLELRVSMYDQAADRPEAPRGLRITQSAPNRSVLHSAPEYAGEAVRSGASATAS